ncbi:MAG: hypothetical protein MRY21_08615 [Simkaniaceae bacterium]|nr:hypothetical protein [Simkaniaceae bacterium]
MATTTPPSSRPPTPTATPSHINVTLFTPDDDEVIVAVEAPSESSLQEVVARALSSVAFRDDNGSLPIGNANKLMGGTSHDATGVMLQIMTSEMRLDPATRIVRPTFDSDTSDSD